MPYCRHCDKYVSSHATSHHCRKRGLLNVNEDDSFLVSTIIGAVTDSTLAGGLLGGSFTGGLLGDTFDGDLMN